MSGSVSTDRQDMRPETAIPGVAVFVIADIASFMLFFGVFMADRIKNPEQFAASAARLDVSMGLVNTLILISSGWCVAQAEQRYATTPGASRRWLLGGLLIGSLFAILKLREYGAKIAAGINPDTDPFFTYYFVFTGVHFLHYVAGMAILTYLSFRHAPASADYGSLLRTGAMYWHMVDILWIFIFPLLYLQVQP